MASMTQAHALSAGAGVWVLLLWVCRVTHVRPKTHEPLTTFPARNEDARHSEDHADFRGSAEAQRDPLLSREAWCRYAQESDPHCLQSDSLLVYASRASVPYGVLIFECLITLRSPLQSNGWANWELCSQPPLLSSHRLPPKFACRRLTLV